MGKFRRIVVPALAAAMLGSATLAAQAEVKWDLSTIWADNNYHTLNAKKFAEEVARITDGEVQITVKAGGQLGFKGPEHLRAVRDGLIPMADVLNIQQVGDEPILGSEAIPFLAGSAKEWVVLHKHLRPVYETVAARNNQKILYMVPWPTQYLHLKEEVTDLAALKGVKIRVPDKGVQNLLEAVGVAPVLIPWGEVIPALASGAVAGVSTSSISAVDGKFWEFLKVSHATNHVWSSQMMNVNLDQWNELSPEHQQAIVELAAKMEPEFWKSSTKADTDSVATLEANGMKVVEVAEPMLKELRAKTAPLMEAFFERVPDARAPVTAYLKEMNRE